MIDEQLQGLIMPPETAELKVEHGLGLVLLLGILLFALWRWQKWRNSPLKIAEKNLQSLIKLNAKKTENKQQISLRLVSLLCEFYGVKRLDQVQTTDNKKWDIFRTNLNSLCYSDHSESNISDLLNEAKQWLNKND